MPVANALEHLVGLQAQEPWDPYYALWSRLDGFDPHELGGMIERFEAVRMGVMRGTIHVMTARDALVLRGAMGSVMSGTYRSSMFSRQVRRRRRDELLAIAAELTAEKPQRADLSRALSERWPEADFDALGLHGDVPSCRWCRLPHARCGARRAAKWLNAETHSARRSSGIPIPARWYCGTSARSGLPLEGRSRLVLPDRAARGD